MHIWARDEDLRRQGRREFARGYAAGMRWALAEELFAPAAFWLVLASALSACLGWWWAFAACGLLAIVCAREVAGAFVGLFRLVTPHQPENSCDDDLDKG